MRYFVYVDEDGKITWSPASQGELFKRPRDGDTLMNSPQTVARIHKELNDDTVWELVGDIVVISKKDGNRLHTASLEPNTIHEVTAGGIITQSNMRKGDEGFEPIPEPAAA